jgi:hypothetical protein
VSEQAENPGIEVPSPIVLAHELRSHLGAVSLGASILRRHVDGENPQVIRALDIIERSVLRATELTTWVLAAAPEPLPEPEADLPAELRAQADRPSSNGAGSRRRDVPRPSLPHATESAIHLP